MKHPLIRMIVGLTTGFLGAYAVITAMEWFEEDPTRVELAAVIGAPDFDRYCDARGLTLVELGSTADRWRCTGRQEGFWVAQPIEPDDVCREQFAATARQLTGTTDWHCVARP